MNNAEKPKISRSLSTGKVVLKAVKLADEAGLEAMSMRKLASTLGVTAMSLYNHVANKDDLLDLMLDQVVTEFESPTAGGNWREMMARRANSMHEALLRHRWASRFLVSKIAMGDAILRDIDATVGCLARAGFTYGQADWARNAIDSHVYGYTMQEQNIPVAPEDYQATAAQYLPMISKVHYPFMHEAAVQIVDGSYDGVTQFQFGLDLILDGLDNWLNLETTK